MGTVDSVSRKYVPLYVAEFEFRYDNRLNEDIFGAAIKGCSVDFSVGYCILGCNYFLCPVCRIFL